MSGRALQDTVVDEADDSCPLCVEEFDLSDKNFRPCPCGYQVCQFCYNNIKNNMNGLCPACRRPYDDKNIEWKIVSPEEAKADIAAQAKKKAAMRQKEAERKHAETLNRKHLAGLRVLQKNLVYVVGMDLGGSDDDVLQTLRGPQHFGQYGKIVKIVVSKAKEGSVGHHSLGIYVTFVSREDAQTCIAALDGSLHEGRVLRAQYGTTKYCSAFLRNETCNNRSCMFLHETGEDSESYSRQDLSSLNAVGTQRPSRIGGQTQALPPPQQGHQIIIMASQLPNNPPLKPEPMSRSDSGDGPGLPPTANWAKNPQVEQSRRSSQAASRATPSPKSTHAKLIAQRPESRTTRTTEQSSSEDKSRPPAEASPESPPKVLAPAEQEPNLSPSVARFEAAVRAVVGSDWKWSLDRSLYDDTSLRIIDNYPPLIAENGGAVRFAMKAQQSSQREQDEDPSQGFTATTEDEEHFAGGSLQLGGEPETVEEPNDGSNHSLGNRRNLTHQGSLNISPGHSQPFDSQVKLGTEFASLGIGGRSLTPQQLRNYSPLNSTGQQHDALLEQFQRGGSTNTSQHQPQLSNPFQVQNQQLSAISRHGRQASRYNFSHEPSSSIGSIKPSTNAQLMAQQSAMMPHQQNKYGNQPLQQPALHSNFYSGVQGPPPGLRSSGTPPISGGGMFGQGHGFTSTAGFGGNLTGKNNDDLRDMFRGRNGIGNGIGSDAGKREYMFPSFLQKPSHSPAPAPGPSNSLHGSQIGASIGHQDIISMKPKKKGKKHRHANTSSSGGGAIVDLADPSILQARMHHAGVGQGPYGGTQGQGGYNSHAMMYGNGGYGGRW